MELTYKELSKKDVINVVDGRCLGRIVNANFNFPKGVLTGIFVPARKNKGFFWFFDKSTLFISVNNIIKIGGDVILVDLRCGDNCAPSTTIKGSDRVEQKSNSPCAPPCPPPCPPVCKPPYPPKNTLDLGDIFDQE